MDTTLLRETEDVDAVIISEVCNLFLKAIQRLKLLCRLQENDVFREKSVEVADLISRSLGEEELYTFVEFYLDFGSKIDLLKAYFLMTVS